MKSVLISIQPKWCKLIASGKKTVEVRKTRPKLETPFKCYIYCTASDIHSCLMVGGGEAKLFHCCNYKTAIPVGGEIGNGKVIGEFVCDWRARIETVELYDGKILESSIGKDFSETAMTKEEIINYAGRKFKDRTDDWVQYLYGCYAWHISDLKIYDKPKELREFVRRGYANCDECAHVSSGKHPQEFVWHNEFCGECRRLSWEKKSMKATHFRKRLTRPPQSWCYVEEYS